MSKTKMVQAMGRGTKHVGNLVWTAIHVPDEGVVRATLADALARNGLHGAIPEPASEQAAFGRAVRAVQRGTKESSVTIERDQRFGRAVLIRVNRGKGKEKTTLTYAKVSVEGDVVQVERNDGVKANSMTPDELNDAIRAEQAIDAEYQRQKELMDHGELGLWLVHALIDFGGAVRVRDEGVIYFVPPEKVDALDSLRAALFEAAPKSSIPAIRVMDDDESVAAVGVGIASTFEREVQDVLASLAQITSEGKRRNTTLANRLTELSVIASRAYACDEVLGAQRDALVERMEAARKQIEAEISLEEDAA